MRLAAGQVDCPGCPRAGWLDKDLTDVHWLTTWLDEANDDLAAVLGLPHLPVLGGHLSTDPALSSGASAYGWWKADLVDQFLEQRPGTPLRMAR